MSGFNFGGFDLTSGFNSLSDIGDKLQKLKEDVESTIDASFSAADQESKAAQEGEKAGSSGDGEEADWLGFDVLRTLVGVVEDATTAQPNPESVPHEEDAAIPEKSEETTVEAATTKNENVDSAMPSSSQEASPDNAIAETSIQQQNDASPLETKTTPAAAAQEEGVVGKPPILKEENPEAASAAAAISVESQEPAMTPSSNLTAPSPETRTPRSAREEAAATVAEGLEAYAASASGGGAAANAISVPPHPVQPQISASKPSPSVKDSPKEPRESKSGVHDDVDLSKLGAKDLCALVLSLKESLAVRESQLERQAQEAADAAATTAALTQKNEELVLAKAAVSEKDLEEMRKEFENRLTAAEKKIVAVTKERDALKKPKKGVVNAEELLKQKDEEIKQIMEEGEALSKKQLTQETTMKQLRAKIKSLKEENDSLVSRFEAEQERTLSLEKDKEKMAADLTAAQERQVEQLAAERQHFERLLAEARTAAAVAEKKAEDAMKAGAERKLRDAESKVEALEGTVDQLREELERKRAAADEREDLLSSEVAALQRRCAEAEARQQELHSKLPEATAPLLQQLESMQIAAEKAAASAAESEKALQNKLVEAESAVLEARKEAEKSMQAVVDAEARVAAAEDRIRVSKEEITAAKAAVDVEHKARLEAESLVKQLRTDVDTAQDSLSTLERVYAQQLDALQAKEEEAAKAAAALREELRSRQQQQQQQQVVLQEASPVSTLQQKDKSTAPTPPALAAPGFKWVMMKEGESGVGDDASLKLPGMLNNGSNDGGSSTSVLPTSSGLVSALAAAAAASRSGSHSSDASALAALQRTVYDLEATRDRLSEELVRAEGEAASGRAIAARSAALELEIATVQQRYASAMELLGEREEKIEELSADIVEMRDGYRQQVACLADEIERLQQRVLELETVQ